MNVYLIRHAQSYGNVQDLRVAMTASEFNAYLRGSAEHALTPTGEQQAQALAERLRHTTIDRLYTSPFARTRATAERLGNALGLTPEVVDELREVIPAGLDETRSPRSLRRFYLRAFAEMAWRRNTPVTWRSEYQRAQAAWARITATPAQGVAAVSHAWMISLITLALRRDPHWQVVNRDVRNCGVSLVVKRP